ncbi:MAG: hypothetical protein H6742_07055 [Alphaproteobacteria bacterium]|nr:hypothetical protein [Alphaproteobacteria bacterium]
MRLRSPVLVALVVGSLCGLGPAAAATPDGGHEAVLVRLPDEAARREVRALGLGFAEGGAGDMVLLHGPPGSLVALRARGLDARPAPAAAGPLDAAAYHDPDEVLAALDALAEDPRVTRVDLGRSVEGRPIAALRIGGPAATDAGLRLLGGHHGDEWVSVEVALDAADRLVAALDDDPSLAALLDRHAVWVLPLVNPDGHAAADRYSATTVDLNRNYDYAWSATEWRSGAAPFSEPETRAVRSLHELAGLSAGLSFHAGDTNIGWVWNHSRTPTADAAALEALAEVYAAPCDQDGFWITNGAEWYPTWGDTNDWAYGRLGAWDFTVEVSRDKIPDGRELPAILDAHWAGTRAFLLAVGAGSLVEVRDAETGQGLPAELVLDPDSPPRVTGPDGRVLLPPGVSPVEVRSAGMRSGAGALLERGDRIALPADRLWTGASGWVPAVRGVSELRLSRPGHAGVEARTDGAGWRLSLQTADGADLAPGAWDLQSSAGACPRCVLVADPAWTGSMRLDGDTVLVSGLPAHRAGASAQVLVGPLRLPAAAPVSDDGDQLRIDLAAWRDEAEPVDLVVHAGGVWPVAVDLFGVDPEPADSGVAGSGSADGGVADSGSADSGVADSGFANSGEPGGADTGPRTRAAGSDTGPAAGCGCGVAPLAPPAALLLLFFPLLTARRRP